MHELVVVTVSGLIGGLVNAYLQDGGFKLPGILRLANGQRLILPGFLGNMLVGMMTAVIMWGLYGAPNLPAGVHWQWASHTAASALAGIGGSKILTNEIEKKLISTPP